MNMNIEMPQNYEWKLKISKITHRVYTNYGAYTNTSKHTAQVYNTHKCYLFGHTIAILKKYSMITFPAFVIVIFFWY